MRRSDRNFSARVIGAEYLDRKDMLARGSKGARYMRQELTQSALARRIERIRESREHKS